jgi:hypothetical protein
MQALPTALEVNSLIEQENMWSLMRDAADDLPNPANQPSLDHVSTQTLDQQPQHHQATVTLEHVALHTDQMPSDRLIVLGKVFIISVFDKRKIINLILLFIGGS